MIEDKDIKTFCDALQRKQDEEYPKMGFKHVASPLITFSRGQKYTRIVKNDRYYNDKGEMEVCENNPSVHCFIDNEGNILKADGWKRPAKGIRGHVNNGAADVSIYGAASLR